MLLAQVVEATGAPRRLARGIVRRALPLVTTVPPPRRSALRRHLHFDRGVLKLTRLGTVPLAPGRLVPARMHPLPGMEALPALSEVSALCDFLRISLDELLWLADLRDLTPQGRPSPLGHYHVRLLAKPGAAQPGVRVIESPKQLLKLLQRRILREILDPLPAHPAVHGFRRGRSILTFAAPHAAQPAVLRLDLQDFFPSLAGTRIQALFRTLGYPEPVADLLGALCTCATPAYAFRNTALQVSPEVLAAARRLYRRPHLPQGAPTSPALANLCAFRLDSRLTGLARSAGAVYTRYADDLAFSGPESFARKAQRFALHAAAIALEEGFAVNHRKTRLMRPSARQHLAGLTVNVRPALARADFDRLKAILTNCLRRGPSTQNREGQPDFQDHVRGLLAHAAMVNATRAARLRALFNQIDWSA